ncbi:MAG: orotidine 5'-phosphate decarboxylase / HUMPS family protein [Pyrobaculum sp.]
MRLQVALDLVDLRKAIELTRQLCAAGLELVEAGTPLIKTYGLSSVSALKAACPGAEVVADLKTADVGRLEAQLAKEFGADWGTVLGATNMETIVEFINAGREIALKTAVDLIGVSNPVERAREVLKAARPDLFVFHLGVDVQKKAGLKFEQLLDAACEVRTQGVAVAIAGGITEREVEIITRGRRQIDVVIVGRAITGDMSPVTRFIAINKILKSLK